jgi:hypothetical protein
MSVYGRIAEIEFEGGWHAAFDTLLPVANGSYPANNSVRLISPKTQSGHRDFSTADVNV